MPVSRIPKVIFLYTCRMKMGMIIIDPFSSTDLVTIAAQTTGKLRSNSAYIAEQYKGDKHP